MIKREEIKYRIGTYFDNRGASILIYIDSRAARRELNLKFGFGNWQFTYSLNPDNSVHGALLIKQKDEWLKFEDVGYCTNSNSEEPLKDAVSDALKRCAVQVGVAEELYDAPFLWVPEEGLKKSNGKVKGILDDQKKIIEGNITKWYDSIRKKNKN